MSLVCAYFYFHIFTGNMGMHILLLVKNHGKNSVHCDLWRTSSGEGLYGHRLLQRLIKGLLKEPLYLPFEPCNNRRLAEGVTILEGAC